MRVTGLLIALIVGTAAAQQPDVGPPPGQLIDIGGRVLHLHCTGKGAPTVVLEAGASAFAIDWTLVQREVARTNRVCSYDRAGMGWSPASAAGMNATVIEDLQSLLKAARESPPYVMVGASLGGLFVRLYHADHPDEVIGLVLVDPASEDRLFTMFQGQAVEIASLTAEQMRSAIPPGSVTVPRRPAQTGAPFDRLPRDLYETRVKLDERLIASTPSTVTYEVRVESAERERARLARLKELRSREAHPLGNRPLVVLTRGVDASDAVREVHATLARLSTNSRHTIVAGAGHEIHLFEPGAVVQAIADVAESIRTKMRLPAR